MITASEKEVSLKLLDSYGLEYANLGNYGDTIAKKILNIPIMDLKMYETVKGFKPDIFLGLGSIRAAHASFLLRKKCILLEDTESSLEQIILYLPFVNIVFSPQNFKRDLGNKQVRFNGFKELAYLHPNYYKPSTAILDELGLSSHDRYVVLRFVSWNATHDIGRHGIRDRSRFVEELEKYGRVLITSEGPLERKLSDHKVSIPPEKMHDLLYHAALYAGEGGTMATEAALLGTPSVYVSSLASLLGNFIELEKKYGLLYCYDDGDKALEKSARLLQEKGIKEEWKRKKDILINDKIDVTAFLVEFIENYRLSENGIIADLTRRP